MRRIEASRRNASALVLMPRSSAVHSSERRSSSGKRMVNGALEDEIRAGERDGMDTSRKFPHISENFLPPAQTEARRYLLYARNPFLPTRAARC
jgi:hypothetical protein